MKYDDQEWFRSSQWNPLIAEEFERRLLRARAHNRPQYVRVQATHLAGQPDRGLRRVARDMFLRVIDEYHESDPMTAMFACEQLGWSYLDDRMVREAEAALRRTLAFIAEAPQGDSGTSGVTGLVLAELLYWKGGEANVREAELLLDHVDKNRAGPGALFRDVALRYSIARARVGSALRDPRAGEYAEQALQIARETRPSIPRHPDLGRPQATEAQIRELRAISAEQRYGVIRRGLSRFRRTAARRMPGGRLSPGR